jgi:hypothetical protein
MAHHKRKRPKSTRSGCLMCKPHKRQGSCLHARMKVSARRGIDSGREQLRCEAA